MKKIIIHWTAGTYTPSPEELISYHYIIDSKGTLHKGHIRPEANLNCYDGLYAKHCGGGNTGAIGFALAGMMNFKNQRQVGPYPLTKKQVESALYYIAEKCLKYKIPITKETVLTHYEFGKNNQNTSSKGKIDIIHIPCEEYNKIPANKVGDFLRQKITWYYNKMKGTENEATKSI